MLPAKLSAQLVLVCCLQRLGLEAEPAAAASSAVKVASHVQIPETQALAEPAGAASTPSSLPADVLALVAGHG